ncbi:hypothetical protein [Methylobacterium sp. 174MFSha1.1]|uniref:hypothetical protein n=1 Tax=Methylobacterium sp. 174MFSha1.1 TaxID=1502749 RepID=UPI000B805D78|nr:hypothetical protein [Methylobacterium sp. 174MFSha1.1]
MIEFLRKQDGAFRGRSVPEARSALNVRSPVRPPVGPDIPTVGDTVMIVGSACATVQEDDEALPALGSQPIGQAAPDAALRAERGRFDLLKRSRFSVERHWLEGDRVIQSFT